MKFVAHFISQLAENVIFVYLGLFMFSNQYEWSAALVLISIVSCVLSRAVMVVIICMLVWYINVLRLRLGYIKPRIDQNYPEVSVTPQRRSEKCFAEHGEPSSSCVRTRTGLSNGMGQSNLKCSSG